MKREIIIFHMKNFIQSFTTLIIPRPGQKMKKRKKKSQIQFSFSNQAKKKKKKEKRNKKTSLNSLELLSYLQLPR
jgi:hypothetical protein